MDPIQPLVSWCCDIDTDTLPSSVLDRCAELFLDTMGCLYGGSSAEGVDQVWETVKLWGGNPHAGVPAFNAKTNAPNAVFINSVMIHANDYDDTHDKAVNHGCVTVVPALLAAAEVISEAGGDFFKETELPRKPVSGRAFLSALAAGLEVTNRLGLAFIPYLDVAWLPTSLWGPFGAAAAIGKLLAFDETTMLNAFGLAYSQIHGNREALIEGRLAKRMQPAFSAVAGLNAAFLAFRGVSAANDLIGGAYGIPRLYTKGQADTSVLAEDLGRSWECMNISVKPYPCCRCTHPVIDAALFLKDTYNISGKDIKEADIYLPPTAMGQVGQPFRLSGNPTVAAQFSAAYTMSLVFNQGRPGLKDFKKDAVESARETAELAKTTRVHEFAKDTSGLVPVELIVQTKAGRKYKTRIEKIKGAQDNPLTEEEQFLKFSDNLKNGFPDIHKGSIEKLYEKISNTISADSIAQLVSDVSINRDLDT